MIIGGQVADCTAGELLLEQMPHAAILHGDKGYDSNAIRRRIEGKGVMPNIPPKANRRWKNCFSPFLYRNRNAIERTFCRLKDFRRIATRYDRLATNYLAAVCLAAAVSYWEPAGPGPSKDLPRISGAYHSRNRLAFFACPAAATRAHGRGNVATTMQPSWQLAQRLLDSI